MFRKILIFSSFVAVIITVFPVQATDDVLAVQPKQLESETKDSKLKEIMQYGYDKTHPKAIVSPVHFMKRKAGKIFIEKKIEKKTVIKTHKEDVKQKKNSETLEVEETDENDSLISEEKYPEIPSSGMVKDKESKQRRSSLRDLIALVKDMRESGFEFPDDLEDEMRKEPLEAGYILWDAKEKLSFDNIDQQQVVSNLVERIEKQSGMKYSEIVRQSYEQLSGKNSDKEDLPCPTCNKPRKK